MEKYKTFRTELMAKIQLARKLNNKELEIYTEELLKDYDSFNPKDKPIEIEIISGWKGQGDLTIYHGVNNNFICTEPVKDKTSGDIETRRIEIKKEDVNNLLRIIGQLNIGEKISCYDISKQLGWANWKDLWRERKVYFKTYYYPLKILEKLKIIEYGARATRRLI